MNARAPVAGGVRSQVPGRAFSFGIQSGQLETLKWLALAAMLVAHGAEYIFGVKQGWALEVGRVAFPLFALAYAVPLSKDPEMRGYLAARTLLPYAIAAQCLAQPLRDGVALNVLFQFLAAGAWFHARWEDTPQKYGIRALCLVVAFLSEFSLAGFALIVSLVRWCEEDEGVTPWWTLIWLVAVAYLEGSPTALVAFLIAPFVLAGTIGVTRIPRLFPAMYVGQFALYWVLRAFT